MKAPSRHKSSLSGSFRQVSRVGLMLQLRGTAPSDEDGLFNATARDRRRGCLRCNSRENHGSDGVPFLHNAVLLSTIISLNLRGVALHRCGRAGHRSTRITCGYYRTRASQVGGCPFSAQDLEQNFFAVTGRQSLLGVATESGVFSLELCLPFLERVCGSVEVFQICTILSHQVFGTFQQFFRGWTVGRHSGCKYTPLQIQSARKDRHAECPTVRC